MSDTFTGAEAQALMAMAGVAQDKPEPVVATTPTDGLADILARCKGVRETGEKLVDAHIEALWATRKLSKIEAAKQGLVASEHNRAAWAQVQVLRGEMKSAVRKHCREGAHVATKVAEHSKRKTERNPQVDAFLLQHAGDTSVQALAQLLGL